VTVTIDATNLVLIDAGDATTGWTSSMGGLNTVTAAAREGGIALQDQASEESYEVFHTITSEDYTDRTVFGWQKSGAPSVEADPAGLSMVLGDALRDVATAVIAAAGTGYAALEVLTVSTGTVVAGNTAATIRVDTVGGSGEILTSTLTDGGGYSVDASSPDTVSGGGGVGATFTLTFAAIPNRIAFATGGQDNFGFFFQGWSSFRLNLADLPTNTRVLTGVLADLASEIIVDVGYGGDFPGKAAGNADNVGFDVLRYCSNTNPALLIEGGSTGARGTFQEIVTEDEDTNNAWGIARILIPGSKAYEVAFGIQLGSLDADAWFEDSDFQMYLNGAIPDSGAGITAGSMDVDCVGDSGSTNVVNFNAFFIQSIGAVSNWTMSADLDEAQWQNGSFTDCGTFTFPVQDAAQKFVNDVIFTNCGQVYFSTMDADGCIFNGASDPLGAVLWDAASDETNQPNLTFNSDSIGHAIEISLNTASLTTFNITGYEVVGYEGTSDGSTGNTVFIVDNDLDGDVDINVVDGTGAFSYERAAGYTGTVTVNQAATVIFQGMTEGSSVKLIANESVGSVTVGDVLFTGRADSDGLITYVHNFEGDIDILVRARNQGIAVAAIADDGGVFTDETDEANDVTADDVNLFPATPADDDAFYFAHTERFNRVKVDVTDANGVGSVVQWEYWTTNPAPLWLTIGLSNITGNIQFENLGNLIIDFGTILQIAQIEGITEMTKRLINGQGPFYYVRARLADSTNSNQTRARRISIDAIVRPRYLPFPQTGDAIRTIISTGLTETVPWVEDSISKFDPDD